MTKPRNGLLLVMMDPPAAMEEEFQAWYDTEHIPERAALPGFQTALRFVAVSGYPRYMAIYDMDEVASLHTPEYYAVSGAHFTPWTRRVTSRTHVTRLVGEQIYPGHAATETSARQLVLRFRDIDPSAEANLVSSVRNVFEAMPETKSVRVFAAREQQRSDYLALISFAPPPKDFNLLDLGAFASSVDIVNMYTRRDLLA